VLEVHFNNTHSDRAVLDASGILSNELYQYDLLSANWTSYQNKARYGNPPSARIFHSLVAVGSYLFVFGGMEIPGSQKVFIFLAHYLLSLNCLTHAYFQKCRKMPSPQDIFYELQE
jgi:hypothetical protein